MITEEVKEAASPEQVQLELDYALFLETGATHTAAERLCQALAANRSAIAMAGVAKQLEAINTTLIAVFSVLVTRCVPRPVDPTTVDKPADIVETGE